MIATLRHLLDLLEPGMRWAVLGLFVMMMLGGVLEMLGIGLFLPFMLILFDPQRLASLPLPNALGSWLATIDASHLVMGFGVGMFLLYLVKNIVLALLAWLGFRFTFRGEAALQRHLLETYLALPYVVLLRRNSSEFVRTIMNSTRAAFKGVLTSALALLQECILALAALFALVLILPIGGLIAALVGATLVAGLYLPLQRLFGQGGAEVQHHYAHMYRWIVQALGAVKELKILGRETYFLARFSGESQSLANAFVRLQILTQLPRYLTELIVLGALTLTVMVLSVEPGGVVQALPMLGVFAAAALRLLPSTNRIIQQLNNIREGAAAVKIVHDDLTALPRFRVERAGSSSHAPIALTRQLAIEDVSLRHVGAERNSIEDVSLNVQFGEVLALVGVSGAGKTTLVDVVLGLLQPSRGCVKVDGTDIRVNLRSWQDRLGYVPQAIYLLDDTVRRNIAFGIPDDQVDEAALAHAITVARLGSVVAELPNGLETPLGENGVRLSGGQRQRIGIARALYHSPDLLVFDEATSALDSETEREIVDAIDALRGTRTVILIAHRLTTVRHCDRVALLERGRLVDCGSFDAMAARCAPFQRMLELSLGRSRMATDT
ncbi:MAG: ABC transporter ATP-binding protein [Rhodospirillales bacterium]|nr:ABC transporter ATP-binding protein [Rhodospirillales bacterium]